MLRLEKRLRAHLAELEREGLLRKRRPPQGIDLSSNDYLGLAAHPLIKERMAAAVCAMGAGSTGSRLLRGERDCFTALEQRFAEFKGTERSLYFGSGYLANLAVLTTFPESSDTIFSDERNHASLIDGVRLSRAQRVVFPHLCPGTVAEGAFLVTESVFSMDGDIADVKALQGLAERYGANLMVDEAHATAVHGPGGAGLVAEAQLTREVFATVHTCGKALASAGAFVCGSRVLREFLINHARTLIFSTAMPPYMAGQIRTALRLAKGMDSEREALLANSAELLKSLRGDGWDMSGSASQIVPVIIGSNEEALSAAAFLQDRGFAVRAIRPPTVPAGTARLRLSLTARITREQVTGIRAALQNWRRPQRSFAAAEVATGRG